MLGATLYNDDTDLYRAGVAEGWATGAVIRPEALGTLSEVISNALLLAGQGGRVVSEESQASRARIVLAHRTGERQGEAEADVAVGIGAWGIKSGPPSNATIAKLNRLICIQVLLTLSRALSLFLSFALSLSLCLFLSLCLCLSVSLSFPRALSLSLARSLARARALSSQSYAKLNRRIYIQEHLAVTHAAAEKVWPDVSAAKRLQPAHCITWQQHSAQESQVNNVE